MNAIQKLSRVLSNTPVIRWIWYKFGRKAERLVQNYRHEKIVSTKNGAKIKARLNSKIESKIYWYGYQPGDLRMFEVVNNIIEEGWNVVDVGANIGAFTLPIARRVSPGTVHAIEPVSKNYRRLLENIEINNASNVVSEKIAMLDESGSVEISNGGIREGKKNVQNFGAYSTKNKSNKKVSKTERCNCITLDGYIDKKNNFKVDLIKIDVEGAEEDVLKGSERTLLEQRPVIVVEVSNEREKELNGIIKIMRENGYRSGVIRMTCIFCDRSEIIWSYESNEINNLDNLIGIPKEKEIEGIH